VSLIIVDTGCANLSSVAFALDRLGRVAKISRDPDEIKSADHVILPGVGAAPFAMRKIRERGFISTLQSLKQPLMGICLGMQLLYEELEEGGETTTGLGLLPGRIRRLDTKNQPAPHMGWNRLEWDERHPLLKDLSDNPYAYFVHSYAAKVSAATVACATHGTTFSAIVHSNNVFGCQFHPERSSRTGSQILENFLMQI